MHCVFMQLANLSEQRLETKPTFHFSTLSCLAMSNSGSGNQAGAPHVAIFPSSGGGHLMPFLRLATILLRRGCRVTLVTAHPIVSLAETRLISRFLAAFPQVAEKHFTVLPLEDAEALDRNVFILQWVAINRSGHLLASLLSSLSQPVTVLISDITLISSTIPVTLELKIPNFVLFISSARMFSVLSNFPAISEACNSDSFQLNGAIDVPRSSLLPAMLNPDALFTKLFKESSLMLEKVNGVLINTFEGLETEALECQPPTVFALGPFLSEDFEKEASEGAVESMGWLDNQPARSVVYVNFGSWGALRNEQIRELASGLVMSGSKFLWIVKTKNVDKEDEETIEQILGMELLEKIKNSDHGFVLKGWVSQGDVLGHKAVGGFLSQCGWNSVVEAAWHGVPVVGWPLDGADQRIHAEVVEAGGWGRTMRGWSWGGDVIVKAEEIGATVKEVMGSEQMKLAAKAVGEAARKAVGERGSGTNDAKWQEMLRMWNKTI